jgi:hypothetical protein
MLLARPSVHLMIFLILLLFAAALDQLCPMYFFGLLNGLCSSTTKSTHIDAAKRLGHRSNRNTAILQMIATKQRM